MTETKFWSNSDIFGLTISIIGIIILGFLYSSNAIDINFVIFGILAILLFPIGRNAIPAIIALQFKNQLEGKGIEDHWQKAREQINETPNKYDFDYNYQLPQNYFPYNNIELEELGLALFEINRDDLSTYSGEDQKKILFKYAIITLIVKTANGKIKATLRGKNLEQTIQFINQNIELWKPTAKQLILPEKISSIEWGQPIKTTQEAKK